MRASVKILRPRSHGLNFWPRESVGEDFFIDGLVAPPSPSVCVCVRAIAIVCVVCVCLCLCVLMCVFEVCLMCMLREFVTWLVQL